jgi:MFS family permease
MNVNVDAADDLVSQRSGRWYHGWNIVAVCILSMTVANGLTFNALSLFLKPLAADLHTQISSLTLGIGGMVFVCSLLSPVFGILADKLPARRLLAIGLAGMSLFYLGISFITAAWQFLALYWGVASVSLTLSAAIVTNPVISRWFVRRRALALSLSAFGMGLAGVLLPPLVARLLPTIGWRLIWRGGAVFTAVVCVPLVLWLVRDRPTAAEGRHYMTGDTAVGGGHSGHGHGAVGANQLAWREVLSRKNFWLLLGIYLPMVGLNGSVIQNIGPMSAKQGFSVQTGGTLLAILSLAHVLGTPVLGVLSDRVGNRLSFVLVAVTLVTGAVMLALSSTPFAITLACVLIGFGGGWFPLLGAAIANEFGADNVGRAYGLCMLFLPLSTSAAFILAKTQERTGSYAPALLGMAGLVAVSGVLSLMLRERRPLPTAPVVAVS